MTALDSGRAAVRRERVKAEAATRLPMMLADLRLLVECESPSNDLGALDRCAEVLSGILIERLGRAPEHGRDVHGSPVLTWSGGDGGRVLMIGHFDTVWPLGTLERIPFSISDGVGRGPGIFDMKAGLVIAVHALAILQTVGDEDALAGMTLLANSDEELGSPGSRAVVEELARHSAAVLVLEGGGAEGEVTVARKGLANYRVLVTGRAAHAGVEPQKGINAAVAASRFVLAAAELSRPGAGTTVTPTLLQAGESRNTVPASAEISIDVRAEDAVEQQRIHRELTALAAHGEDGGAVIEVLGAPHRLAMTRAASATLHALAMQESEALGIGPVGARANGGGSDANLTAALGIPSIDGLGAIGSDAHADNEHIVVDRLVDRLALVAAMLARLAVDEVPSHPDPPISR